MTVIQMEQQLAALRAAGKVNDHTTVFIRQMCDDYPNSLVLKVDVQTIHFDPENGEPVATDECLVITDDV